MQEPCTLTMDPPKEIGSHDQEIPKPCVLAVLRPIGDFWFWSEVTSSVVRRALQQKRFPRLVF